MSKRKYNFIPDKPAKRIRQTTRIAFTSSIVFCISIFCAGLYQFSAQASKEASFYNLPKADAIVVLTGEQIRIHSAVKLLQERYGKRLLISGVSNHVSDKAVMAAYAPKTANAYCCIDLDRLALDTKGNAEYTAEWVHLHAYKNVIVVTSSYHMPRSLDHLRREMPTVNLIPAQVIPADLKDKSNLSMMLTPKVVIEYVKFLLTRSKLEPVVKYMWTSIDFHTSG